METYQEDAITKLSEMLRVAIAALIRGIAIMALGLAVLTATTLGLLSTAIGLFARQLASILITLRTWIVASMPWLARAICVLGGIVLVLLAFYRLIVAGSDYVTGLTAIGIPALAILYFQFSYATILLAGLAALGITIILTNSPQLTPFAVASIRSLGVIMLFLRRRNYGR